MNSANAFSYAISGSFNEKQITSYQSYVNQAASLYSSGSGWLAQQANKTVDRMENFVNSRVWELGKRLLGVMDGEHVGRFDIGYLGSLSALQGAEGCMRDVIMAHPGLHQDYLDGEIVGYDGEFSQWSQGVGKVNLTYRKMWDGVLHLEKIDDVNTLSHSHFHDTTGGGFSFRDKVNAHKTHAAIDHHRLTTMFDITSPLGEKMKKHQSE